MPFKLRKVAHASSTAEACDDILGYLQDRPEYNQQKFYFCSDTYPPTKDGLKSLKDALILAAHDPGLKVASARRTSAEDPSCPFESQYTVMTAVILSEGAMCVPISVSLKA